MYMYKIQYSYLKDGKRITEYELEFAWCATDAVKEIRIKKADLENLRIEQVWKDTGKAWEVREIDDD